MPNRKHAYADQDKWRKTKEKQKRRYYGQTAFKPRRGWTQGEEELVLEHKMTDRELSERIGHSVGAIQIRRNLLKKTLKKER